MKIVLLDLGGEMRGGQRQVLYLASFLSEDPGLAREFKPLLACPLSSPLAREAAAAGVEVFPLPGRRFWNPLVYLRLKARLKKEHGALVHSNDAHSAGLGAALAAALPGLRLMHTRRVSYPLHGTGRAAKYQRADAVAAVSAEIAQTLVRGGVSADKIRVIHSGIDPVSYPTKAEHVPGPLRFAVLGALTEQKGHETLVRALPYLNNYADMPDFEVLAAGQGPLLASLLSLASELGVEDRIKFIGQRESRALLPGCDILLSPSNGGEGSNATIKEGWAVGLPVIASALPSNMELVVPGESGLAFPPGDAPALAEAMRSLAVDSTLRHRLVEGGRKRLKLFTSRRMAQSYVDWYRELAL